jgi:phosphoribosylformimino-5-aminoimidazole carboxamide ribotide isomerase
MIAIIPAIDIIEGKCIRLTKGRYESKKIYNENPLEVAKKFEDSGLKRLHLVDLDGARNKSITNWRILELISNKTTLKIDMGGGIQSDNDIRIVFECGADQVNLGSIAVKNRKKVLEWLTVWGKEKIILSADVNDKKIAIHGWQEKTEIDLFDFVGRYHEEGIEYLVCTDISKDGMLEGVARDLYQELKETFPKMNIIASGGLTEIGEIEQLAEMGIDGVIIGKAIYEGKIKLEELHLFLC